MTKIDDDNHRAGRLVIIGGGEDRTEDMQILSRFVALSGGEQAQIAILTAASKVYEEMGEIYERAFGELGATRLSVLHIESRAMANDGACAEEVYAADGIFMTGGDQKRLLAIIGGTQTAGAMHRAFREHGACIAGTSAGASAMSEHMLAEGEADMHPKKGTTHVAAGLGFLRRVMIDQHFSERQRLARLLSAIAANPYLLGVGIDENTALVVDPNRALEVIGQGAATIIDGREMDSNVPNVQASEPIELINVRLHLLRAGFEHVLNDNRCERRKVSAALEEVISIVTNFH